MIPVLERFLRYVAIETTSDESSRSSPTTACQWDLLRMLEAEMREMGLDSIHLSDSGVLYARVPGGAGGPVLGLVAHVDTSSEAPGASVKPVLHPDWDGSPIELLPGVTIDPAQTIDMPRYAGTTIVTSDGTTLLGADDKAGVAIVMELCRMLMADRSLPRPSLSVAFTPDEEAGRGVDHFDTERFGADFAYTIDGSVLGVVETQTFNAASADWRISGRQVHPGSAKGIMINALRIACGIVSSLRPEEMPENSEGMQGYDYPMSLSGNATEARLRMILRDFTSDGMRARRERLEALRRYFASSYPGASISLEFREQYSNPVEILEKDRRLVEYAMEGARKAGLQPREGAIRGGTDGSRLSFMGVPCVNLPTGGELYHSRSEWISERGLELALDSLVKTIGVWSARL
jgi:tripeptide aminopeptidase